MNIKCIVNSGGKPVTNNDTLNKIVGLIKDSKRSLVLAHQNPDGDTLGSMLALGAMLKKAGHAVDHVMSDPVPQSYKSLPFAALVKLPTDKNIQQNHELAFSLDCGSLERLGSSRAKELWLKTQTTINIDHHISNEKFAKVNWIETDASSTGQLVYYLAKGLEQKITPEIATLLYATLLTDTGCFANSNTNADALIWGAELIKSGAQHEDIYRKAFLERPFKALKLAGAALNNLTLIEDGQIAWTYISSELMKSLMATGEDTEDIPDYIMKLQNIKVGVFFREDANEIKVSLRSLTNFDVSEIAVFFGGGGHRRASGANIKGTLQEVKDLVLKKVQEEFNKWSKKI